jgi:hypothetical protein
MVKRKGQARDMVGVSPLLTPEMHATLQKDCDRLRAERRINRLENIAVRTAEMTEAWQESGQDYVTVHFLASLLDYTTDESGTQVLEGSRTEPVKFAEYWTFVRPVGTKSWELSAIQQAAEPLQRDAGRPGPPACRGSSMRSRGVPLEWTPIRVPLRRAEERLKTGSISQARPSRIRGPEFP